MNRRKFVLIALGLAAYIVYYIFKPHYTFTYFYSPDRKSMVTAVNYYQITNYKREENYITYGYYDKNQPPDSYIVIPRTHQFLLAWKNGTCIIYSYEAPYATKKYGSLKGKIISKRPTPEEWAKMRADKSGAYIYKYSG